MRKKIRVVQFGVGPIGASIVRVMREKASLEIVGAIDRDPAKAGRDLGELTRATDAPWGVTVHAEALPHSPIQLMSSSTQLPLISPM